MASSHFLSASSFTFQQAKEISSPKRRQRLLTKIRGNAILFVLKRQKGFHDGNVEGALFFCGLVSLFLLMLCTVCLIERRQMFEYEGGKVWRRLPVDRNLQLALALCHLRKSVPIGGRHDVGKPARNTTRLEMAYKRLEPVCRWQRLHLC